MLGWSSRFFFPPFPLVPPSGIRVEGLKRHSPLARLAGFLALAFLAFGLAAGARLLETPYWDNPAYRLGGEYLLATHDAYHWIAGAEGFEFGAGHPMSELARLLSEWTGIVPANVGFWLPPLFGGLLAAAVFAWGWAFGFPFAGVCAGVLSSLAPAFLARTMLGFYDTDLVVLLFAVLLGLGPALWMHPWLASFPDVLPGRRHPESARAEEESAQVPARSDPGFFRWLNPRWRFGADGGQPGRLGLSPEDMWRDMLHPGWLGLLILAGLFGWQTQGWHSLFPYLTRFSALVIVPLALIFGPRGGRAVLLRGGACYALPMLLGLPGAGAALVYALLLAVRRIVLCQKAAGINGPVRNSLEISGPGADITATGDSRLDVWLRPATGRAVLALLWIGILVLCVDAAVFTALRDSFVAYVHRGGDVSSLPTAADDPLVYPSVSQSILEVQTVTFQDIMVYTYPLDELCYAGIVALGALLLLSPVFVWFAPLLALALLSLRMGARMTMFSPPVLLLPLCMIGGWLLEALVIGLPRWYLARRKAMAPEAADFPLRVNGLKLAGCVACSLLMSWPLINLVPYYVQGPAISREQAAGLAYLKDNTPSDSLIWNWWDWGYATHHFARRHTIADGARHGGPSLYLPAAVYNTTDPRFARQLIKYTAAKGNQPGNVFHGLSAGGAQRLMTELGDRSRPLVEAPGRQYVVVSFDLLRLGLWVSQYGSWNFETRATGGRLMNNLDKPLEFNTNIGVVQVLPDDASPANPLYAAGIDVFSSNGLERHNYNRYGAYHYIFNFQTREEKILEASADGPLVRFWKWRTGKFAYPTVVNNKMAVEEDFYNTMMVQLLVCDPADPVISPYFRLVFNNVYTRIYEVL